jgi:hypothetical protein
MTGDAPATAASTGGCARGFSRGFGGFGAKRHTPGVFPMTTMLTG